MAGRICTEKRTTSETEITLTIDIDGTGNGKINTGIGFFDHMLELLTKHGLLDLKVNCKGDLHIDGHHTVEDVGIVMGAAIKKALGDKSGIKRYGSAYVPMDEALILCALDFSGRPYLVYDISLPSTRVGDFDTELVKEFLQALVVNAGFNLHVKMFSGENNHHIIEGIFKALGQSIRQAVEFDSRIKGVMSTKGTLS